jgi:hypothetical protein
MLILRRWLARLRRRPVICGECGHIDNGSIFCRECELAGGPCA